MLSVTLSMRKLNLSCHTSNQNKAKMSYSCERLLFQGFDACIPYGREKWVNVTNQSLRFLELLSQLKIAMSVSMKCKIII